MSGSRADLELVLMRACRSSQSPPVCPGARVQLWERRLDQSLSIVSWFIGHAKQGVAAGLQCTPGVRARRRADGTLGSDNNSAMAVADERHEGLPDAESDDPSSCITRARPRQPWNRIETWLAAGQHQGNPRACSAHGPEHAIRH